MDKYIKAIKIANEHVSSHLSEKAYEKFQKNIRPDLPTLYSIIYHKGCWNDILEEADVKIKKSKVPRIYTKQIVIDLFKKYVMEENRVPMLNEFVNAEGYPSSYGVYRFFDHFDDLVIEAGYSPDDKGYTFRK